MVAAVDYINKECFCLEDPDCKENERFVCKEEGGRRHWTHVKCLTDWAVQKRKEGVKEDQITCYRLGNGVCKTNLAQFLPQKSYRERAADFFRKQPAAQMLAVGVPLLVLNRVAGAGVGAELLGRVTGAVAALAVGAAAELGVAAVAALAVGAVAGAELGAAKLGAAELGAATAGAVAVAAGGTGVAVAVAVAAAVAGVTGVAGALAVVGAAGGAGAALQLRDFIPAGAVTAGLAGASIWLSGGGWFLAGAYAAVSAVSTYYEARRILFG